jgi:hypothetical protein
MVINASQCLWAHLRGFGGDDDCQTKISAAECDDSTYGHKNVLPFSKVGKEYGVEQDTFLGV